MSFQDLTEEDVSKFIIANAHIGHKQMEKALDNYIFGRQQDGTYIFNIDKTFAKLQLAARVLVTIKDPQDIAVVGSREEANRAIHKFCKHTGAYPIVSRFMPGTFTNRQSPTFREPKIMIVNDPVVDHQALKESSYANIPTIAFVNSDSKLNYVDIAIPCNNKGRRSIGLMYWFLCREYLRMKGTIKRSNQWEMPDTFIQLTEEDVQKMNNEAEAEIEIDDERPARGPQPKRNITVDDDDEDPFAEK